MSPARNGAGVRDLVLVGHGMVGQSFLEAFFEEPAAARWRVTVLAEESRPAYDRVHLTSWFSGTSEDELSLCTAAFLREHHVDLRLGDPAVAVDRAARTVGTASGRVVRYDALVLATGSYPFVPPVPGHDARGCHVYRTLEDLAGIRADAERAGTGAVVGGGLLGLEAAGALTAMGLTTHVVEFAPRLMSLQVDDGGGELLRRKIEALGVVVHTSAGTERIESGADGRVRSMALSDGSGIEVDLVVFSAGVRPRDELARGCGLPVGERGGVVVDTRCRTGDPRVWAVGECARAADGRVYGLVAPGYAMARAAARDLIGRDAEFTSGDTSTKLKLLGVDVASFGDAHGATEGSQDVLYTDSRAGVYKKLVIGSDGALLGGVLVGDTESYAALRPLVGSARLPGAPERLLLPARRGAARMDADLLADSTVVCSCHHVTKAVIRSSVGVPDCVSAADISRLTKAGTSCGSCLKMITGIVDAELSGASGGSARGGARRPAPLPEAAGGEPASSADSSRAPPGASR